MGLGPLCIMRQSSIINYQRSFWSRTRPHGSNEFVSYINSFYLRHYSPTVDQRSSDPFIRSMSYWFLKEYRQALNTLYEIDLVNVFESQSSRSDHSLAIDQQLSSLSISQVFNFYTFLKNHPLVIRQLTVDRTNDKPVQTNAPTVRGSVLFGNKLPPVPVQVYNRINSSNIEEDTNVTLKTIKTNDEIVVTPIERRLHFMVAYCQLVNGCPLLTLDVLSKLPNYISTEMVEADSVKEEQAATGMATVEDPFDPFATAPVTYQKKVELEKASLFDWSAGVATFGDSDDGMFSNRRLQTEPDEFKIEFSDDDEDEFELSDEDKAKNTHKVLLFFN